MEDMMAKLTLDDIEYHSEHFSSRHAAVNVKVYSNFRKTDKLIPFFERIGIEEEEFNNLAESTLDILKIFFWEDEIQTIGKECGFNKVWSEGRSGGWAVPYPYISEEDLRLDKDLRKRFFKFQKEVRSIVDGVDDTIYFNLKEELWQRENEFLFNHSVTIRSIMAWKKWGISHA
jgi:hypothetical protein